MKGWKKKQRSREKKKRKRKILYGRHISALSSYGGNVVTLDLDKNHIPRYAYLEKPIAGAC